MSFPAFPATPAALLPFLLAAACSSQPPPARAYANVTIEPTPLSAGGMCNFMSRQPFLLLGVPAQPQPTRVDDGSGQAHVNCTVSPSAGGTFQIQLSANSSAPTGGQVTIVGQVDQKCDPQGTACSKLTATFVATINGNPTGQYSSMDCTVTYVYMNGAVPLMEQPVAAGRIWAHISCPAAQRPDLMTNGMPVTCDTEADFVFENCGS